MKNPASRTPPALHQSLVGPFHGVTRGYRVGEKPREPHASRSTPAHPRPTPRRHSGLQSPWKPREKLGAPRLKQTRVPNISSLTRGNKAVKWLKEFLLGLLVSCCKRKTPTRRVQGDPRRAVHMWSHRKLVSRALAGIPRLVQCGHCTSLFQALR